MSLADQLDHVQHRIATACARAGRSPSAVHLVAVTKTVPAAIIAEAYALGLRQFGENRVQERQAKCEALAHLTGATWRLIGPLQSNKAGKALDFFDTVDSLDSLALAARLDRLAAAANRRVPVLLEVNIGGEPQKSGISAAATPALAAAVATLPNLELRGLMAVPPAATDPESSRSYFAALAGLGAHLDLPELSMGMSHDFEVAIAEGATHIRIGSALFGARA